MVDPVPSPIPFPQEAIQDTRSGLMSRAWRYFLTNLFKATESSQANSTLVALAPAVETMPDTSGTLAGLGPAFEPVADGVSAWLAPAVPDYEPPGALGDFAPVAGATVHSQLMNLVSPADDHTQYALLAGRSGGQVLTGGTDSGDDLTFQTTSDASKGSYLFTELTASRVAGIGASSELLGLDTATYPSLTELAYVKGVTSAVQTQLDAMFLRAGRASPQQAAFGTASGASTGYLTSTAHATKGKYFLNAAGTITVDDLNVQIGVGIATPLARLHVAGARSSTSWTTTGLNFAVDASTLTDTSGSGTIGSRAVNSLAASTLASSNSVTLTRASTLYVGGPPVAGTNTTITNPLSIYVASGNSLFAGFGTFGSTTPEFVSVLTVKGNQSSVSWNTSGISFNVQAATYTDTTGSGAISSRVGSSFLIPTFASSNAVTLTNATSVYIAGVPVAGANTTITNAWAFLVDAGNVRFDGSLYFPTSGSVINFNSGNATITHSAALLTSNVNFAVPDDAYAAGWNGSVNVPTKNAVYDQMELKATIASPVFTGTVRLPGYTVATLPAAGTAGRMAYVTDALAPAWNVAIAGGGAIVCKVFDNGAAWVAG